MAENFQNTLIGLFHNRTLFPKHPVSAPGGLMDCGSKNKTAQEKKQPASATEIENRRAENAAPG